ncbi:MAG: ADP-ribosylglycohydrolase family protein [Deltaproteobacteria bacterium]|nr:ADP-ribosylglycohydrolase family protein [Deltaproteobacteria bacterium]MBT6436332.1 ADP-ribosylglycohydrolase family protein [Deltaproteobacteria bacterium]MBT6490783.1 ADP-ribosylglycohydrolase family protein [Deltaproteobacteria bacterium]
MNSIERAYLSLNGLSVGDALGETFFGPNAEAMSAIARREVPAGPWRYTDDTQMAISVVAALQSAGQIDPQILGQSFAKHYDTSRGYGPSTAELLEAVATGEDAQKKALASHGGQGSYGSGAAMRVAPLGAFFADDLSRVVHEAQASAMPTHTHCEAIAGTIAIAVASALATKVGDGRDMSSTDFLKHVLLRTPESVTRNGINTVYHIDGQTDPHSVAEQVGSGQSLSAQDTVPFALWCAANNLHSYEDAFWKTVSGLGDRDTTCAMVGGIVAMSARSTGIPEAWLRAREPIGDLIQ